MKGLKASQALEAFEREMAEVINKHGIDALAETPDFILAGYVTTCIAALKKANHEHKKIRGES